MAEERFEEKTQPATPRRRQEARERGHVARSTDLTAALLLLAVLLVLEWTGDDITGAITWLFDRVFGNLADVALSPESVHRHLLMGGLLMLRVMAPLIAVVLVAGVAANALQVGFLFTTQTLEFHPERLDPVQGIQRLLSGRAAVRLLGGLLKIAVIGAVLVWTIWGERFALIDLADQDVDEIVRYLVSITFTLALRAVLALLVLAIMDYTYERFRYEKDLRMSRQEVQEELKRLEGDPKIKRRRFAIHQRLVMQRMMQEVPKATVVITNPTEYAVAIRYDDKTMPAPRVVAKGTEHLALKIRQIALEHRVPIRPQPELARALYAAVDVGQYIPEELYQAVAEVLAWVYQQSKARQVA